MLGRCETLMLDMDGTVLDLAFDNYVWLQLIPEHYAEANDMSVADARAHVISQARARQGKLEWYCLDHWSEMLGLDILGLHRGVNDRICFLPGAKEFLEAVRANDVRVLLVTNSHPGTLDLKDEVTGLSKFFDAIYTSHEFGFAKERQEFWRLLEEEEGFRRESTLFVDDSRYVLASAATYGIEMLVEILCPDSSDRKTERSAHAGIDGVADLLDRSVP